MVATHVTIDGYTVYRSPMARVYMLIQGNSEAPGDCRKQGSQQRQRRRPMTRPRRGFLCLTLAAAGMATWSTTPRAQIKTASLGDDLYCFASGGGATYFRWCLDAFGL